MAEIAKSGRPSVSTLGYHAAANTLSGLYAGESITAGDACYIKSDGKVYKSSGAAVGEAAAVHGFAPQDYRPNEPMTLIFNVTFRYGARLTPGKAVYLSGSVAGGLADAASTGGAAPIGFVIDATRIYLFQSRY